MQTNNSINVKNNIEISNRIIDSTLKISDEAITNFSEDQARAFIKTVELMEKRSNKIFQLLGSDHLIDCFAENKQDELTKKLYQLTRNFMRDDQAFFEMKKEQDKKNAFLHVEALFYKKYTENKDSLNEKKGFAEQRLQQLQSKSKCIIC